MKSLRPVLGWYRGLGARGWGLSLESGRSETGF